MLKIIKFFLVGIILSLFIDGIVYGFSSTERNGKDFSIDLQDVSLADVLHMIAKFDGQNVIVSRSVAGIISLHLHHVSARETFKLLLASHGLVSVSLGSVAFITLKDDWVKHEADQLKMQELKDTVAPLVTQVWQIHYARAQDISHLLGESGHSLLSRRGQVHIDKRTNSLCIQDTVDRIQQMALLIRRVDVPVQQVLIEAHLASVDSDFERNIGVHFSTQKKGITFSGLGSAAANATSDVLVAKLDSAFLTMQLNALESSGHGELISSPRLFTANQQTAAIESGEEIPYQEESANGGTMVMFKKAVLSLKVTPQILPGKKVLLQLQINQDKPSKLVVQGVPAISTRQLSTSILVRDGETVVLGGVYESNREHGVQAIPFLAKIPLLGFLFQQNDTIDNKRVLLIFVTPKIIPQ